MCINKHLCLLSKELCLKDHNLHHDDYTFTVITVVTVLVPAECSVSVFSHRSLWSWAVCSCSLSNVAGAEPIKIQKGGERSSLLRHAVMAIITLVEKHIVMIFVWLYLSKSWILSIFYNSFNSKTTLHLLISVTA